MIDMTMDYELGSANEDEGIEPNVFSKKKWKDGDLRFLLTAMKKGIPVNAIAGKLMRSISAVKKKMRFLKRHDLTCDGYENESDDEATGRAGNGVEELDFQSPHSMNDSLYSKSTHDHEAAFIQLPRKSSKRKRGNSYDNHEISRGSGDIHRPEIVKPRQAFHFFVKDIQKEASQSYILMNSILLSLWLFL